MNATKPEMTMHLHTALPNWKIAAASAALAFVMTAPAAQAASYHHRTHRAAGAYAQDAYRMDAPGAVRNSYAYDNYGYDVPVQGPVVRLPPGYGPYGAYAYDPNDPMVPPFPDYCPYNTCRR